MFGNYLTDTTPATLKDEMLQIQTPFGNQLITIKANNLVLGGGELKKISPEEAAKNEAKQLAQVKEKEEKRKAALPTAAQVCAAKKAFGWKCD